MIGSEIKTIYRLLFTSSYDFYYDHICFARSRLKPRQIFNYLLRRLEVQFRAKNPLSYPLALQLEPTIHCQLRCSLCPRLRATNKQNVGHMEWDNYEKLIREAGPYLLAIAFWQWGEPLLHPRISDMIRLAHEYGILTIISTNGQQDLEEFDLTELIRAGLDMAIISMDGSSQTVYEKFRVGGSVAKVRSFAEALVRSRNNLDKENPLVNLRIIATKENEPEIDQVRNFASEIGADLFSIKSVSLYYDSDPENPNLPVDVKYRSFQYQNKNAAEEYKKMPNLCLKPWTWPTLRWDGRLLVCECDHDMQQVLGNVFEASSFRAVWRSKKAQKIRSRFSSKGRTNLDFCQRCRYKLDDAIREVVALNNCQKGD